MNVQLVHQVFVETTSLSGLLDAPVNRLMPSIDVFGSVVTLGYLHTRRARQRRCTHKYCWDLYARYYVIGAIAGIATFVLLQLFVVPAVLADTTVLTPLTDTRPAIGSTVQAQDVVANTGDTVATGVHLVATIPAGLHADPNSVHVKLDGNSYYAATALMTGSVLTVQLRQLSPGETYLVTYDMTVTNGSDPVRSTVTVTGDNMQPVTAN